VINFFLSRNRKCARRRRRSSQGCTDGPRRQVSSSAARSGREGGREGGRRQHADFTDRAINKRLVINYIRKRQHRRMRNNNNSCRSDFHPPLAPDPPPRLSSSLNARGHRSPSKPHARRRCRGTCPISGNCPLVFADRTPRPPPAMLNIVYSCRRSGARRPDVQLLPTVGKPEPGKLGARSWRPPGAGLCDGAFVSCPQAVHAPSSASAPPHCFPSAGASRVYNRWPETG
jgi:hypothetical protein